MHKHPASEQASSATRPFLKWVGGKQRLVSTLLNLLPPGKRLIEPFVGAGSVFLASDYPSYVINDANPDLVAVWAALQTRPKEFIQASAPYFAQQYFSQEAYNHVRAEFNQSNDSYERATRFLYLNRFCFNGLFRVNSIGDMNTPYGHPKSLPGFPWNELAAAAQKLRGTLIFNGGFESAMEEANSGDVVYCDPPYLPMEKQSFNAYTAVGFDHSKQKQLVRLAKDAAMRGATVLISNHDTEQARALYEGFHIHSVSVRRSVGADTRSRVVQAELVASVGSPMKS